MIILFNKSDLLLAIQKEELSAIFADMKVEKLFISAKKRENITILEKKLVQAAALTRNQPKRYYHYKCTPLRSINTSIGFYS